jgi:hypothetical protein
LAVTIQRMTRWPRSIQSAAWLVHHVPGL